MTILPTHKCHATIIPINDVGPWSTSQILTWSDPGPRNNQEYSKRTIRITILPAQMPRNDQSHIQNNHSQIPAWNDAGPRSDQELFKGAIKIAVLSTLRCYATIGS